MPVVPEHVRRTKRRTRSRDTTPELAVRRLLHARGWRYRVNHRVMPGLRRTVDIAFTRERVVVLIDGCFWHRCPIHYVEPKTRAEFWRAKIDGNVTRDADTDRLLIEEGWTVLRFWEHEEPDNVAKRIEAVLLGGGCRPPNSFA